MLTITFLALIWLFLYTLIYTACGLRLTRLIAELDERFAGLLGTVVVAVLAMIGTWMVIPWLIGSGPGPVSVPIAEGSHGVDSTDTSTLGHSEWRSFEILGLKELLQSFFVGVLASLVAVRIDRFLPGMAGRSMGGRP